MTAREWSAWAIVLAVCPSTWAGQVQIPYVDDMALDQPQVWVYLRDSVDYLPHGTGGGVFAGLLDTGAGAHVLPKGLSDLLEVPLDPMAYAEVLTLCGYPEIQDVSQPLRIGIGPYESENEAEYTEIGPQRLIVRKEDPPVVGLEDFPMVVGTPFLKDHPVYVDWELFEIFGLELTRLHSVYRSTGQPAPGPVDLTVPLTLVGETNLDASAKMPAAWSVPFMDVVVENGTHRQRRSFILDTGAQITFISTELAQALGVDLTHPDDTLPVVGAGTCDVTLKGYTIDKMLIPTSQDVAMAYTQPIVFVLDVPGIDGGIGSNTLFFFEELLAVDFDLSGGTLATKLNVPIPPGGDMDGDGACILADLKLLVAAWGSGFGQPRYSEGVDVDLDGGCTLGDMKVLVHDWGRGPH